MKIKSIIVENIQSVKKIKIDLDEKITRLQGRNTSGKSVIKKSLGIFTGNYSRDMIKGLLRKDKPYDSPGKVSILLEDGNILNAVIYNTGAVNYILTDTMGNVVNRWNGFNEEIIEYLGWKNVEDEKLSLNIKESETNLFINTKPKTNGVLVDYLCKNPEIEFKIEKLEEKADKIKELLDDSRMYLTDLQKEFDSYPRITKNELEYISNKLVHRKASLNIYKSYVELLKIKQKEIKFLKVRDLLYKLYKIKYIELNLTILNTRNRIERYRKLLDLLNKTTSTNKVNDYNHINNGIITKNSKIKRDKQILDNMVSMHKYKHIEMYINISKNLENTRHELGSAKQLNNILASISKMNLISTYADITCNKNELKNILNKTNELKYKINTLYSINKADKINNENIKYLEIKENFDIINNKVRKISLLNRIGRYEDLKNNINNQNISKNNIKQQLNIIYRIKKVEKNIIKFKELDKLRNLLLEKLDENNICPTCKQPIKKENYKLV